MKFNIYQKAKIILNENSTCKAAYNKCLKLSVESTDETLNGMIKKLMTFLSKGRIYMQDREAYFEIRKEISAYIEMRLCELNMPQTNLKAEIKTLLNSYEEQLKVSGTMSAFDEFEAGTFRGNENTLNQIIDDLRELLKKY